jgi:hypothetical protein|tara:strand:- start:1291 stop:1719 length:429 start_codon:yes stop_codon:yes gene_type:complete
MEVNVDMTQYSPSEAEEKICHILQHTDGLSEEAVAKMVFNSLCLKEAMTLETLKVMMECAVLFDGKQHDYGSRNIAGWPTKNMNVFGVLVRLNDKIQRLANLTQKAANGDGPRVQDEKLSDTAHDICNYGAILELLVTNRWT